MCFGEDLRSAAGLLFKQGSSLCTGAFTCAFLCVFEYACCTYAYGGALRRQPQPFFLRLCSQIFLFETWSLVGLELTLYTWLSEQRAPGTCLLPSCQDSVTRAGHHTWLIKIVTCLVVNTCMYVCAPCILGARRGQKRSSDPLELELQGLL